jgi:glutathione S-transferase
MSLIFYNSPMSTATLTELVIAELGVPCERVQLDIKKGDTKKPDFLKLNPNGKVPVIVHDGTVIWESAAITLYLGETFGVEKKLYPPAGAKRAEAMKWVVWTNVTLGDALGRWARNTQKWIPEEQHNAKSGEAALAEVKECLGILDGALEGKQFVLGADYSIVDTHVNSLVDWARHMKADFSRFPRLNAWSELCTARPAYAKVMAGGAP